jgi:hypothetical protein
MTTTEQSASATASAKTSLAGVKVMLMGPSGTGKTHSIGTLVDSGIEVFYFAYEQGTESLLGYYTDFGKPVPTTLHVCTVAAPSASFLEMADAIKDVGLLSYESLKKRVDPNKAKYDQLERFLRNFNDVTDDGGGKFGPISSWNSNRAIVIDGLTGMCNAAMQACIGGKFDRDQKDWGLAQNMIEGILRKITTECRCHVVLLSHVERETDPTGGGLKIMASALGKALAPKLPAMFSDVIMTKRLGKEWFWDTEDPTADLKTRNLPISAKLAPSFGSIIGKWKSRGGTLA